MRTMKRLGATLDAAAGCDQMLPGGDQVLPGGGQMLPGGDQVRTMKRLGATLDAAAASELDAPTPPAEKRARNDLLRQSTFESGATG